MDISGHCLRCLLCNVGFWFVGVGNFQTGRTDLWRYVKQSGLSCLARRSRCWLVVNDLEAENPLVILAGEVQLWNVGPLRAFMLDATEIRKRIDGLHNTIARDLEKPGTMMITPLVLREHAAIVDLTSQLAEISSARIEQQTATLIKLTRRLFYLTWILVGLTGVLVVFTYFLVKCG